MDGRLTKLHRLLTGSTSIGIRHPETMESAGVDVPFASFDDDALLVRALDDLNARIADWPVAPITLAEVRAL